MANPSYPRLSTAIPSYPKAIQKLDPGYPLKLGKIPSLNKDFVTKIFNLQTLIFLAVFRTLASQIGPILRRSCLLFERPDFFLLGLPSVGLGKGYSILVGEARRKRVTFFPLCHSKTWSNTKQLGTTKLSISCRFSIDYDSKNLTKVW